ncbi:Nitrogen assimilation transcription factor nit-4-like protein 2 [Phlyctema vagabunda]|uniref:Nitrogen assimilation transcription factor nit-4-like protein 2 n=1 Tax=Phlyctema vagabunda TaxID=108571 RepID=A0ABR4P588_9HELO
MSMSPRYLFIYGAAGRLYCHLLIRPVQVIAKYLAMSFRKIRAAFRDGSKSGSNPTQSISESSGFNPRQVRDGGISKDNERSQISSKRRRAPDSVTRNACLKCKKARAKCDGKQPCKRCTSRADTSECVYELHNKHAKADLVRQIKDVKAKEQMKEQILHAISSSDDEQLAGIIRRLREGDAYQNILLWLGKALVIEDEIPLPKGSQHSTNMGALDRKIKRTKPTQFQWTYVTSNTAVVDHLFQLYFAWVHPVHTLFSEGDFMDSYKTQSTQYCSGILVNAICAMACHLHSHAEEDKVDFNSLSTDFSDAVRSSIDPMDISLTTIQTLAILFLVSCGQSQALQAASYLRIATRNMGSLCIGLTESSLAVFQSTLSGLRNLNIEWAQITFQVPDIATLPNVVMIKPCDIYLHNTNWYFYRFRGEKFPSSLPGLSATIHQEKSELLVIVNEILTLMYSCHGPRATAIDILRLYARLLAWHNALPKELAEADYSNTSTLPQILSLLTLYDSSIVQLLRPLLDLEGFPVHDVDEIIWNHSQHALFLLNERYRIRYTCRYQPVLQMFALLHVTDVIVRFFPYPSEIFGASQKDGKQAIEICLRCLMDSHAGFPIAGPLQEMVRRTADECSVQFPENLAELIEPLTSPKQAYRIDDLLNACTRLSYTQPVTEIHQRYSPSLNLEWTAESGAFGFRTSNEQGRKLEVRVYSVEGRGAQSLMYIHNLLNKN